MRKVAVDFLSITLRKIKPFIFIAIFLNVSKLLSYYKFNEKKITGKVIDFIKKNKIVSLISDAGTPVISDPSLQLRTTSAPTKISSSLFHL